MDNILIERLWRSLKCEAVCLVEMTDGFHAERVIDGGMAFSNRTRPHSSLEERTPNDAYSAKAATDGIGQIELGGMEIGQRNTP